MEPGCEQYCERELDEVEQTGPPSLKIRAYPIKGVISDRLAS
jgi:hypothetical protein